jgi:hypothetical protein
VSGQHDGPAGPQDPESGIAIPVARSGTGRIVAFVTVLAVLLLLAIAKPWTTQPHPALLASTPPATLSVVPTGLPTAAATEWSGTWSIHWAADCNLLSDVETRGPLTVTIRPSLHSATFRPYGRGTVDHHVTCSDGSGYTVVATLTYGGGEDQDYAAATGRFQGVRQRITVAYDARFSDCTQPGGVHVGCVLQNEQNELEIDTTFSGTLEPSGRLNGTLNAVCSFPGVGRYDASGPPLAATGQSAQP